MIGYVFKTDEQWELIFFYVNTCLLHTGVKKLYLQIIKFY